LTLLGWIVVKWQYKKNMGKDLKKEITNQELLDSVNRSFFNLEKKISTKDELRDFRNEMETRLDRIEISLSPAMTAGLKRLRMIFV